jgi:hypothetical protein
MQLVAIRPFRYATRALSAGDRFEAKSDVDAQVLVYRKKAAFVRNETKPQVVTLVDTDTGRLRSQAERLGIKVDKRWGPARLAQEIEAARG